MTDKNDNAGSHMAIGMKATFLFVGSSIGHPPVRIR